VTQRIRKSATILRDKTRLTTSLMRIREIHPMKSYAYVIRQLRKNGGWKYWLVDNEPNTEFETKYQYPKSARE
jgi:hypothetical protein